MTRGTDFDIAPMRSGSMSIRNYGDREHEFPPLGADGVFHADRIPGLDAAKITTGTFDADRIPAGTGNANSAAYAGGFPQASAQREGQLAIDLESLVAAICTNIPHVTAIATGTFATVTRTNLALTGAIFSSDFPDAVLDEFLYASYYDQFWAGTRLGPSRITWVQDTPDDALAESLVTSSNTVHWLGRLENDEIAAAAIGELAADTEYFFYDTTENAIRKLDNSSFTAANGTVAHWQWVPIRADDYRQLIFDARSGNLPAIPPDGSGDDRIGISNDGIHIVDVENFPHTNPTVDSWATYASTTPRYDGVFDSDPATAPPLNSFYYNSRHFTFRQYYEPEPTVLRWRDRQPPDGYIGHYASRQDALYHAEARGVASGGSFIAFTGSLLETATNFTPAAASTVSRSWRFIPVDTGESGGGTGAGSVETLFDNMAGAGVTIAREAGFGNSTANNGEFELSRALAITDDHKLVTISGTYSISSTVTDIPFAWTGDAEVLRNMGSVGTTHNNIEHVLTHYISRPGSNGLTGWAEGRMLFARGRNTTSGNDILRVAVGASGSAADLTAFKVKVELLSVGVASVGQAQASGGYLEQEFVSTDQALLVVPHSASFQSAPSWNLFGFDQIHKDNIIEIQLLVDVSTRFDVPVRITKQDIDNIGYHSDVTWDWSANGDRIPAAYWSSDVTTGDEKEFVRMRPSYFQVNSRRNGDRQAFFVFLRDAGDDVFGVAIYCTSSVTMTLRRAKVIYQ